MKKLNTTGSLWMDANANTYSYNTQLTGNYKGLSVFNNTFYSRTTRKHQSQFNKSNFNLILENCQYGTRLTDYEVENAIKNEIAEIDWTFCQLFDKRNTKKKQETLKQLLSRKEFLTSILSK